MTNLNTRKRRRQLSSLARNVVLTALLGLPVVAAQAQTLRPSTGPLRQAAPTFNRSGLPPASVQRSADFIVAVVNSEPLTNNEIRRKLLLAERSEERRVGKECSS